MRQFRSLLIAGMIALIALSSAVSAQYVIGNDKDPIPLAAGQGAATYAGSAACQSCHASHYADWSTSGHPFKLNTPAEAAAMGVPEPTSLGASWSDIYRVVGGWGWKARYIWLSDSPAVSTAGAVIGAPIEPGMMVTMNFDGTAAVAGTQFNMETGLWEPSQYHLGEAKIYNCQKCHNTGAQYAPGTHQDGLVGIDGTWEEDGVGCEACHGPGSTHIAAGDGSAILVDDSGRYCGYCHTRGSDDYNIVAKGGFIKHHEQYPELLNSPHSDFSCSACHDPHKPSHVGYTNAVAGSGIIRACEDCHKDHSYKLTDTHEANGVGCVDCHMAEASKSARKKDPLYQGDVKTHLFRINIDGAAETVPSGATSANPYIDVGFACLKCHEAGDLGAGVTTSFADKTEAAGNATGICTEAVVSSAGAVIGNDKDPIPLAVNQVGAPYVGSLKCAGCHPGKVSKWETSGHPYKLNTPAEAAAMGVPEPTQLGVAWSDVYRVVGGWGWKARYVWLTDSPALSYAGVPGTPIEPGMMVTMNYDGTVATGGTQWNKETGLFDAGQYHLGEAKIYNCQKCHNTGAVYAPGSHQDGLPGIDGTWAEDGVGCEACHGPGGAHIAAGDGTAILKDSSARYCGYCHTRGSDDTKIVAKGGFIKHHEQYPELLNSPHASMDCVECHDPHLPTHVGVTNAVAGLGLTKTCEDCHASQNIVFQESSHAIAGVECIDCHMAEASKSAVKRLNNGDAKEGDVKTHLFKINTDPTAETVASGATVAEPYLDLGFVCLQCHDGEMTKVQASQYIGGDAHYISVVGGSATLLQDSGDVAPIDDVPVLPAIGLLILGGTLATMAVRRMRRE